MEKLNVKEYVEKEYTKIKIKANQLNYISPFEVFQVGNNPASNKYVGNKLKKCEECGVTVTLNKVISNDIEKINWYLKRGIKSSSKAMVQLPVPKGVVVPEIDMNKDVDGLSVKNQSYLNSKDGKESIKEFNFFNIACTARGVAEYMKYIDSDLSGKTVVIISRSDLVGRPLARLLEIEDMTVVLAHSKTPKDKLLKLISTADYVVPAVGKAGIITSSDIPEGCTVVDVGINFNEEGKLVGDFEVLDTDVDKNIRYTPVPGGVGLLTVQSLIKNILEIPIYTY